MYYFYVLQSQKSENWFSKGATNDLKRRFAQHQNGEVTSTSPHRPFRLVYLEVYISKTAALKREASIKKSGSVWMPLMKRVKASLEEFDAESELNIDSM